MDRFIPHIPQENHTNRGVIIEQKTKRNHDRQGDKQQIFK